MASVITQRTLKKVLEACAFKLGERYGDLTSDGITALTGDRLTRIKQLINDAVPAAQDIIVEKGGLAKIGERRVIHIAAPKTTGATIAVTQGSQTVTLSAGSVLAASDVNRHIRIGGTWFRITAVAASPFLTCTIEAPYGGATITADDLEIYTLYHPVGTSGTNMLRLLAKKSSVIWDEGEPIELVTEGDITEINPELDSFGTPSVAAVVNYQGETRIMFWSIPDEQTNCTLINILQLTALTADTDTPALPEEFHLLWETVAVWLVMMEFGTEDKVQAAALDIQNKLRTLGLKKKSEVDYYLQFDEPERVRDYPWFPGRAISGRVTT